MRLEFSRKQRLEIWNRAAGHCEKCAAKLKVGEGEYDHIVAQGYGGENTVSNAQLLCRVCHREKSGVDTTLSAKVKRVHANHNGISRKPKSRWKRKINGQTVLRETGD